MKILIISDGAKWALDNLTGSIIKYNGRHNFDVVGIHPRNVAAGLRDVQNLMRKNKYDLIHVMYWRSGTQLFDLMPALKEIPSICTHHNHAHLEKEDWNKYFTTLVSQTNYAVDKLKPKFHNGDVYLIPHGVDLDEFDFIHERKDDGKTIGYVGRVIPHKNLKKICDTATKLDYMVKGSGYIEKVDYWNEIDKSHLRFQGGIGREQMNGWESKNRMYEEMSVFVMYSTNEYETGTIPLLEAMARGVPVMATEQGMARDICNADNCVLFNEDDFEEKLQWLMSNRKEQERLRHNARKTLNQYSEELMAMLYDIAYTRTVYGNRKRVSVIIPTTEARKELLKKTLDALKAQTYDNIEIIVSIDDEEGYNLAKARNEGVVTARGELLVFIDDRLVPEKDAIEKFVQQTAERQWTFGNKRTKGKLANKSSFVENFSAIHKKDLVRMGMFNERIEHYGGMSEDLRIRCKLNGIHTQFLKDTIADEQVKSSGSKRYNDIWKSKLLLKKLYG